MSDYSELKRLASLAKNWSGEIGEDDWYTACCFDKPKFSVLDAEFIAKCEPGSVLALIAEVESLREHKQLLVDLREADGYESWASVLVMVDKLKAENEDLRKDAERYRFLRQDISNNVQDFCIVKKRWSATFPDRILELDGADAEIDAAMGKGAKP